MQLLAGSIVKENKKVSVKTSVDEMRHNVIEMQKRRPNPIIYSLEELDSPNGYERKGHDEREVANLLHNKLDVIFDIVPEICSG